MVERRVQFIDRVWPEGVAHIGAVERDPHRTTRTGSVIGDVGECEPFNGVPGGWIEGLRYHDPIL